VVDVRLDRKATAISEARTSEKQEPGAGMSGVPEINLMPPRAKAQGSLDASYPIANVWLRRQDLNL
jgi:hypothetical protein